MVGSVYISGAKEREIDTLQVHCFQVGIGLHVLQGSSPSPMYGFPVT